MWINISISISISIIYLPSGTRGVVAQSPEPGAHDKSDWLRYILFASAWKNSMYIKSENIEWWLSLQFWFEVNNWICWIKCFNLSTCLPVALDKGKLTGGTSLSEGFTDLAWSRGRVRQSFQNSVEKLETFRIRMDTLGIS